MKKYGIGIRNAALAALTLSAVGCMNVDYVGQSFPPLAEDSAVAVYSPSAPPPENMRAIGRVYLTAPQGTSVEEISDELVALAREKGAEAVNIVESKRVNIGSAAPGIGRGDTPSWNRDNRNAGGAYIYTNSFGDAVTMDAPTTPIIELQVKALLMVSSDRFDSVRALYQEERKKLEQAAEKLQPAAETAEDALDKSQVKVEVSPLDNGSKKEDKAEKTPLQMNLTKESDSQVTL